MKIYKVIAKRGKLKYYDEHIHFTLDGTPQYNWRQILNEICDFVSLSLPKELVFETSKIKVNNINLYNYLKSDFFLPIWNNKLIEFINSNIDESWEKFDVTIKDNKKDDYINNGFSAFYLKQPFDCIDYKKTEFEIYNGKKTLNLKTAIFFNDLKYPLIFKIKGMSISNTHYCTKFGKKELENFDNNAFDFIDISK